MDDDSSLVDLKTKKKTSLCHYNLLISKNVITHNTKFICEKCMEKINPSMQETESNTEHVFLDNQIETSELALRSYNLGNEISKLIKSDVAQLHNIASKQRDIKSLVEHDPLRWLNQRPEELVHLLCNLCETDINITSEKKLNIICKIVELIYYCRNSKLALPQHFTENLMSYIFTNCKSYCSFIGSRSPGGSYPYIQNWLNQQSHTAIPFPNGLAKSVFDNNQKVGKTYVITADNTVPTIVMTSHLHIIFDAHSEVQNDNTLKPEKWMWKNQNNAKEKVKPSLHIPNEEFRKGRDEFIESCIILLYQQHAHGNKDHINSIVDMQNLAASEKKCEECGCEADVSHRTCRYCGRKVSRIALNEIYVSGGEK